MELSKKEVKEKTNYSDEDFGGKTRFLRALRVERRAKPKRRSVWSKISLRWGKYGRETNIQGKAMITLLPF